MKLKLEKKIWNDLSLGHSLQIFAKGLSDVNIIILSSNVFLIDSIPHLLDIVLFLSILNCYVMTSLLLATMAIVGTIGTVIGAEWKWNKKTVVTLTEVFSTAMSLFSSSNVSVYQYFSHSYASK